MRVKSHVKCTFFVSTENEIISHQYACSVIFTENVKFFSGEDSTDGTFTSTSLSTPLLMLDWVV